MACGQYRGEDQNFLLFFRNADAKEKCEMLTANIYDLLTIFYDFYRMMTKIINLDKN